MTFLERLGERTFGIIGIAGTILIGLIVAAISFIPFGEREYSAILEHSAGLRAGEDVQVAGVNSGQVQGLELAGQRVKVTFTLDKDIHLGRSSTATVKVATLLGSHYLEIAPAGSGSLRGGTIPVDQTSVPFNLQDVIEGSTKALDTLDGAALAESLTAISDAVGPSTDEARATLDGLTELAAATARHSDDMRRLLASSRDVTDRLVTQTADIIALMRNSALILDELVKRRDLIHQTLIDARRLADEVNAILRDRDKEIGELQRDFTAALANLRKQEKQIEASIDGLATAAHMLANAAGNGPWIDLHAASLITDDTACGGPGGCE